MFSLFFLVESLPLPQDLSCETVTEVNNGSDYSSQTSNDKLLSILKRKNSTSENVSSTKFLKERRVSWAEQTENSENSEIDRNQQQIERAESPWFSGLLSAAKSVHLKAFGRRPSKSYD